MVALTLEKMAEFYLEQERTEEAACAADRALDLRQRAMTVSLLQVGKVALRYGAVREAESAYRRAVDLAPTRALKTRSGYDFATVLRRLGKTAEADAVSSSAAAIE